MILNTAIFKYDPETKSSFIVASEVVSNFLDLQFGVIVDSVTKIHAFKDVSYGYRLLKNGILYSEDSWPKNSTKLTETSEEFFDSRRVNTDGSDLVLVMWVKDNGIVYRGSADIPALPIVEEREFPYET